MASSATRDPYFLSKGSHTNAEDGRCAMEWVAYLAGEPHSASPVCVSPVLRSFCISFNDRLSDEDRQKLRPYLARTIGTAGDGQDPERVRIILDWLVREALPVSLTAAKRDEIAERLRSLPDGLAVEALRRHIAEANSVAQEARRGALVSLRAKIPADAYAYAYAEADAAAAAAYVYAYAAYASASDAADAVYADAYADAYAAYASASAATAAAAYVYAYAAYASASAPSSPVYKKCRAAASAAFKPVRDELDRKGFELLERMLPTEIIQLPVVEDAEQVCAVAVR